MASAGEAEDITLVVIDDVTALLEADEERRAFNAVVSHELRNPLTAIIGHVDLLREREDLPGRVPAQLDIIAHAGERMQDLVASILQQTSRTAQEPFAPVDLRESSTRPQPRTHRSSLATGRSWSSQERRAS